jgi:hypothetical protein
MIGTPMKQPLSLTDLDAQAGFVLPPRETMLVTVIVNNVLNNLSIDVDVRNVNVAVQVCAIVNALNTILDGDRLTCTIQQQ